MIKHRFSMGLLALAATMLAQVAPTPALAQGISQKVAVCDPGYTARCIKPDVNGAVPVTGSLTPSGTQDTNLKQVNGATVSTGAGATGAGSQRTTVAQDSSTVAGSATLPAGENHVGEVGGNIVTVTVPQTVTASSAYTSGNSIGGLMTVAAAARVTAGSGLIQSVVNYSKSAQTGQVDVFLFSSSPSGSTCTDKAAFVLASADFDKVIGVAHVTDWTAGNVASVGQAQTLAMPFALASGTSVFACAVTRSTPTYTATTDVSFGFRILRN